MSVWVSAIEAARIAVKMPIDATTMSVSGAWAKSGDVRATKYTPALTIVAAWMRAETGVGPSIASGSQTWKRELGALAGGAARRAAGHDVADERVGLSERPNEARGCSGCR